MMRRNRRKTKRGKKPRQTIFVFRTHGGRRPGAGRRARRPGAVGHKTRPPLKSRYPVHTSLSVASDLPSLRRSDLRAAIEQCFRAAKTACGGLDGGDHRTLKKAAAYKKRAAKTAGFRLVHYSIQKHHLHLIVESEDATALSRGMQGLAVRVARRINKVVGRKGKVFVDRYFERILKSPKQTRHCLLYVLNNFRRHAAQRGKILDVDYVDPCSSGRFFDGWIGVWFEHRTGRDPPVVPAKTWLLKKGWRVWGELATWELPGGAPQ
jgi:hypothetical protein